MEQDNFNKNIQEKFNFRTIEPSETAWNKLDAMLTVAAEKKQPNRFFWLSIASSFLLFSGVGYVFFQQNKQSRLTPTTEEIVTSKTNCSIIMVPSDVFKNNIPTAYQHYKTSVNSNKQTSKHKIGIN